MSLLKSLLTKLAHEPVAFWGAPAAAALLILPEIGASPHLVAVITGALLALGIPLVRQQVTPTDLADNTLHIHISGVDPQQTRRAVNAGIANTLDRTS